MDLDMLATTVATGDDTAYACRAEHFALPRGAGAGVLRFTEKTLFFEGEGQTIHLPLSGLKIDWGSDRDRNIEFRHPSLPTSVFHTTDRRILERPELRRSHALKTQLGAVCKRRRRGRNIALGVAGGILGAFLLLFFGHNFIVAIAVRAVPVAWEEDIGNSVFREFGEYVEISSNPALEDAIERLMQPVTDAIPSRRFRYRFHVAHEGSINAFALPGGHVTIFTGLLREVETPEELIGVLAHEIAHVNEQHGIRNVASSLGTVILVQAMLGDVGGITASIAENSGMLLSMKFSRTMENEADAAAWEYMVAANVNPRGLIDFLERVHEEEQAYGLEASGDVLSTHPATAARIAALERRWQALEGRSGFRNLKREFRAVKAGFGRRR